MKLIGQNGKTTFALFLYILVMRVQRRFLCGIRA
nr:MAG TPA: hypothetical protein [Caudoviricetes sp.]DAX32805.1 MAG TPA: hypothetical protein [Caudoviricetes sp.]